MFLRELCGSRRPALTRRGAQGDKRLFIRNDELEAAWKLFTPLLQHIEKTRMVPELYPYGSRGPIGAHYLGAKHNVRWGDSAQ